MTTIRRLVIFAVAMGGLTADDLPRRGMLGLAVVNSAEGVRVQQVVPGSAAEGAGFAAGDVLRTIDNEAIRRAEEFTKAVSKRASADRVTVGLVREGKPMTLVAELKPRPAETSPDAEVIYTSVTVQGQRRRVIVTRPRKEGRMPMVLLMHGLGCYSIDGLDRRTGYGRIIAEFEKAGFVTGRVEKTGAGDSEGDCTAETTTPEVEAAGYVAALRQLKDSAFVDPKRVFVFAHSMGPLVGVLAVAKEPVNGFIAVETIGTSWYEYDIERHRVQTDLEGSTPEEVDRTVRSYAPCSFRFYVDKVAPSDLGIGCADFMAPFGGASRTYMQAVADISLGKEWAKADCAVLVVYGLASPVTTAHQSRYLAEMINRMHPGRATYVEVAEMGHDFNQWVSQREYMRGGRAPGERVFNERLFEAVMPWVQKTRMK
jgi:pimeloyl-ACP methyl ester carboxylesterase